MRAVADGEARRLDESVISEMIEREMQEMRRHEEGDEDEGGRAPAHPPAPIFKGRDPKLRVVELGDERSVFTLAVEMEAMNKKVKKKIEQNQTHPTLFCECRIVKQVHSVHEILDHHQHNEHRQQHASNGHTRAPHGSKRKPKKTRG